MAKTAFTLRLHLGQPEPGFWCDTCLLPSAARWPLYGLYPAGVIGLGELVACPACVDVPEVTRAAVERVAAELHGTVVR